MEEFRNQLIGQKEGLQYALDVLEITKKSVENALKLVEKQLDESYKNEVWRNLKNGK